MVFPGLQNASNIPPLLSQLVLCAVVGSLGDWGTMMCLWKDGYKYANKKILHNFTEKRNIHTYHIKMMCVFVFSLFCRTYKPTNCIVFLGMLLLPSNCCYYDLNYGIYVFFFFIFSSGRRVNVFWICIGWMSVHVFSKTMIWIQRSMFMTKRQSWWNSKIVCH